MIQEDYVSFKANCKRKKMADGYVNDGLVTDIVFLGLFKKLRERYKKNRAFSSMDKIKYSFRFALTFWEWYIFF